jgi:Putative prokaryotic signal transducing protein
MDIDPKEIQRVYAEMSDEALLEIRPEELTEVAQTVYDAELRKRGLHSESADAGETPDPILKPEEELVHLETFLNVQEAEMAVTLLRSADIPAQVENEFSNFAAGAGALRLMVPAAFVEQAEEVLNAQISDEDLEAQAEAAGNPEDEN